MAKLIFTCPQTGHKIDSGIVTDAASLSNVQMLKLCLTCPHCGKTHRLPVKTADLCEAA